MWLAASQRVPHCRGLSCKRGNQAPLFSPLNRHKKHTTTQTLPCCFQPTTATHVQHLSSDTSHQWQPLAAPVIWQGTEEETLAGAAPAQLSPTWKVMLLSDGSVTRHLQLLTNSTVQVECLSMHSIGHSTDGLPAEAELIPGPRVQRQVLLRSSQDPETPLVYATSWWAADQVDRYLQDKSKPIWVSLSQGHVELYRDIQRVYFGNSPVLENYFHCQGPFWGRQYFFWHQGKPLTLIYEVFSTKLERFLGPCHL